MSGHLTTDVLSRGAHQLGEEQLCSQSMSALLQQSDVVLSEHQGLEYLCVRLQLKCLSTLLRVFLSPACMSAANFSTLSVIMLLSSQHCWT